ncbi:MAG: hypothetical protein O2V44_09160 [Candidatus Bathyarchaeota archaeon]|nr:hypothetical protein [Candidatus Bathyarchaeota archaeon]
MKYRYFSVVLLFFLLIVSLLLYLDLLTKKSSENDLPYVFVGVDVAHDDLAEIKRLVDEICSYTNLFVIGSTGITYNSTKLDETCQYIYDKGLSFIVYTETYPTFQWLEDAKNRWGERLLGFYAFDEYGGRQLDAEYKWVWEADNYTDAASQFFDSVNMYLNSVTRDYTSSVYFPLFTSDYALYWFDYKGGYDVLLAQFGWNYSRQLNVALCRGAATVQNKSWGAIITWTYNNPPYIESGEELYNDMVLAYKNEAKYVVVFDSNKDYSQGILEEEHLEALRRFWQYVQDNPRTGDATNDRVAYVLPKDYAYGFRGPNDQIWGLWEADAFSYELCVNLNSLIEQYGTKLDIIYDDGLELGNAYGYNKLIFWNGTVYVP